MDVLQAMLARRSVREYTEQPVEREKLQMLLEMAMAAPSGMNAQPWEFVVVDDPVSLDALRGQLGSKYNAMAAIVVCGHPVDEGGEKYWLQDCAAATENILVAAVALGLGACWIAVYPKEETMSGVAATVGLPAVVTPMCTIYLGYAAEEKEPRTQYDAACVSWQKYGQRS
ncbi:nitroreductase family protein [Chloroflexota bacterium]